MEFLNALISLNLFVEWSGEVRNIVYSADGKSVTVVYRVTLYGIDAEVLFDSFIVNFCDDEWTNRYER